MSEFNSGKYWEKRYKNGGNSGEGSYGKLKDFKTEIINNLIKDYNLSTSIEMGCGDGNQLSDFNFKNYVGLDVSETIINKCKHLYKDDPTKEFYHINEYRRSVDFDVSLSLDVLYHLIEDNVYKNYLNDLFNYSNNLVIIYSFSERASKVNFNEHVKYRNMDNIISDYKKNWKLISHIENIYPNSSLSDFYIFKKIKN